MLESNKSSKENDQKNEGKKRIGLKILKNAKKQENDGKNINDKTKRMQILRRIVCQKEYNELKSINNNSRDTSASSSSDISIDSSNIERDQIGSNTNNAVAFKSSPEKKLKFKNELVKSLYKKFQRQCSIDEALKFFKSNKVLASYFDDNFWDEILQVINLSNCTIKQLVEFKQNVVILANEKVSWLDNWLGPKMAPEKIKFAISPDMFQGLVYNSNPEKSFIDYLDGSERQKRLDSFQIMLDGSNDDLRRESCGRLLDIILGNLDDNCQPVQGVIGLLEICRILLGCKTIPVNVDGWKKIFTKINSLSIKDFLKIHSLLEWSEVDFCDLKRFLFCKLNSKDDTQQEVKQFINMFFPNNEIKNKIKNDDLENRLYIFNLFIGSFPSQKLDFSFVTNFAEQNLNLRLSDLNIEALVNLLATVKSNSINLENFNSIVKVIGNKKFSVNKEEDVDKLRQLLCDVLRISGKELGFSNVMDLFLLYPKNKMPQLCTKSTLTNESLKLALEKINKISAIGSNNKNLNENRDEFRSKFKKFIDLFKDGSNKITFDNFKSLILAVQDYYLDFACINYLLEKTDKNKHQDDVFGFFENMLLTKKIDNKDLAWEKLHEFLLQHKFYNRTLKTDTFRYIISAFVKSKTGKSVNTLAVEEGEKDKFREQLKMFVNLFISSLQNNKITFDNFKNLILAVPDDCLDFNCIDDLLKKTDLSEHKNELCEFFETTLLKKISKSKFDLNQVHCFFKQYLSSDLSNKSVNNYKFKAETFKFIADVIIQSNQDRSCSNEDIEWLLQKCCDAGTKLEKNKFVNLIQKGEIDKKFADRKIDWLKMNGFINEVILPDKNLFGLGKIELNINSGLQEILSRTKFCFDENNLSDFLGKILALKKFVTSNELFKIVLHRIPCDSLSDLNMLRTIVYYCFEDIQKYDSDQLIPDNYSCKIDFSLYGELLKTFKDKSLSCDDFKVLNSKFFSGQQSGGFLDFLSSLFSKNESNIKIDHKILRKKLKEGLSIRDLNYVFSKFGDKKLPKNDFVEIMMLAKDNSLTKDNFINLFNNHCDDRIETESNDDELDQIAGKISNASKEDLRDCLVKLNVEKGINRLLNDIKEDFSILFKLTDQKLKEYGLSTLLNQGAQENNMRNNRQENVVDSNYLQLNQNRREPLLNQNNEENNLNNVIQSAPNVVVEVVENLDEGKYGTRMSIIDFKTKYPDIWGGLNKEQRVYLQMILGYKQSLLLTIFCLFLSCVLFVPATTVTYCLGVFFIIYCLLKLTGERTRNRLTEMVQGKSREPSFWDRFFVWNKSIIENARALCQLGENRNQKDASNFYKETKDSILDIMLPEHVSFRNTASSFKDTALRMVNIVSSVFNRNVL